MTLLDRIAFSNGDLRRTVEALRRLNAQLEQELSQQLAYSKSTLYHKNLSARLAQTTNQHEELSPGISPIQSIAKRTALQSTTDTRTHEK
jgi:hypothetical protein